MSLARDRGGHNETAVYLTPEEARYLSILAADDIREDARLNATRGGYVQFSHQDAWQKLQAACRWEKQP